MRNSPRIHSPARIALVVTALVLGACAARAGTAFLSQLTPTERAAVGVSNRDLVETSELNKLVQRDLALARQGNVVGFAKTFTERLTPLERERSGVNLLTTAERAKLDGLVAAAMAARPVAPTVNVAQAAPLKGIGLGPMRPQIHGDVTLFYGAGGHGSSWYGGAFDTRITDPKGRYTVQVGVSQTYGRGLWAPWGCGYGYGPGYGYGYFPGQGPIW